MERVVVHGGPDAALARAELARHEDSRRSMPGRVKGREPDLQERIDAEEEKIPRRAREKYEKNMRTGGVLRSSLRWGGQHM